GVPFTARMPQISEAGTLKDRVDEAWHSVKSGLIAAVSIGFSAAADKVERIKGGGIKFLEIDVYELSLVTIPANANATISQIKSIDEAMIAATGTYQAESKPKRPTGVPVKVKSIKSTPPEGSNMKIEEQIRDFTATRQQKSAEMSAIMEKSAEDMSTLDAEQTEKYDTLADEVKSIDQHLKRLEDMRKLNLETAKSVEDVSGMSNRVPVKAKNTEKLE